MQECAERNGRSSASPITGDLPKGESGERINGGGSDWAPVFGGSDCRTIGSGKKIGGFSPELAGGGPLYDIASHRIDLMNYLFGAPVRASGYVSTLVQPVAVEDNATVLIEYQSGVRGLVDVRWHSRVARDEFRIRGTEGEIELTPLNDPPLVSPLGSEQIPAPLNLHFPCIADFVSAVVNDSPMRSSGATALCTDWVHSTGGHSVRHFGRQSGQPGKAVSTRLPRNCRYSIPIGLVKKPSTTRSRRKEKN